MSFESDFFALLSGDATIGALCGAGAAARIYPVLAPEDAAPPFAVWSRVTSDAAEFAGRAYGEALTVQVDCYAANFDDAAALGVAVRSAVEASTGAVRGALETDLDSFDEPSRLFRRLQSFTLYHPAN